MTTFLSLLSEYYFSEENLMKDFFLRRKMDSEGYLPASLIASFRRVQALVYDVNFIVQAVKGSDVIEVKDGIKVRRLTDCAIGARAAASDSLCKGGITLRVLLVCQRSFKAGLELESAAIPLY